MSLCMHRDDTKLSPVALIVFFTHKLVLVTSLLIGVCCVKVCVPYRVTTWLWCDLPFIEYLVVELDYGKMSATDLSSFDIAL